MARVGVLIAGSEKKWREHVAEELRRHGFDVAVAPGEGEAVAALRVRDYAAVVCAPHTEPEGAASLVRRIGDVAPKALVLAAGGNGNGVTSIAAHLQRLLARPQAAEARNGGAAAKDEGDAATSVPFFVGRSPAMRRILSLIGHVAPTGTTVLVTGESGTGKEVVARAIHHLSPLREAIFLPINCGAIPESLLEGQLFGHVKGSFTGADANQQGLFLRAQGGTILLDEIGELPPHLQVKLLRVIEEKQICPIGATTPIPVKVRIIASTNRDLRSAIREGRFREDLYYRLNVVRIDIPPLRERREDILPLVDHLVARHNAELGRCYRGVTNRTLELLMSLPWQGNVRELDHAIEHAMILGDGEWIEPADLPSDLAPEGGGERDHADDLAEALRSFEKSYIENVLRHADSRRDVATRLGIDPSTLYRKIQAFGIKTVH
ncbi:MAG: sigma-54 interaction domain-containing protein [Candidatus Binatia bacterium]